MPKKLSVDERKRKADEHDLRGLKLRIEAKKSFVLHCLEDTVCLDACYDVCQTIQSEAKKVEKVKEEGELPKDSSVWAEQYNRPEVTPCKLLKTILQVIDKITFSDGNIKSLCKRGARDTPKEELAKLLEYVCVIFLLVVSFLSHCAHLMLSEAMLSRWLAERDWLACCCLLIGGWTVSMASTPLRTRDQKSQQGALSL